MKLVSQVNGDGDIIEAWLRHYVALGVDEFLLVVHGPDDENQVLLDIKGRYPVTIVERLSTAYSPQSKQENQNRILRSLEGQWVVLVDSDEFVELPFSSLATTTTAMAALLVRTLAAPMLQRTMATGRLDSPPIVEDVDTVFPLCVPDLYRMLMSDAVEAKYPLFWCDREARVRDGGNHIPPSPTRRVPPPLRAVTHHYKWRPIVRSRLEKRIASSHSWKHQSAGYLSYLIEHDWMLPTSGSFMYSREELFRRGLLERPGLANTVRYVGNAVKAKWTAHRRRNHARADGLAL